MQRWLQTSDRTPQKVCPSVHTLPLLCELPCSYRAGHSYGTRTPSSTARAARAVPVQLGVGCL